MTSTTDPEPDPERGRGSHRGARRYCRPHAGDAVDLARWTCQLRGHRALPRTRAARYLGVGTDTLRDIERGDALPTPATLERIIHGYQLTPAQERFTRELAEPPVALTPLATLRDRIATPARLTRLARYDEQGIAAALIDPILTVVAANQHFTRAFPGLHEFDDNMALWYFQPGTTDPTSARVIAAYQTEAEFMVAILRAAIGRHRNSPPAVALLHRLHDSPTFTSTWNTSITVAYGRRADNLVQLRDPDTGERYTLSAQLGFIPGSPDIRFCLAYRQP